ncbi:uncharacterized protein LOC123905831 isoform X2 [Trifolium pratense]|uniref:uncharacterized protein LOC123905831 isoform X2 n=1 Tax=Trifolium pratense TaxID=57577 RepID=UPI001E6940F2|nr:uncharacterized protein LOC123905831 isoform X2 [Trifolium pratense]
MNFFTKKRNELQRLCKKHGIPANLKNIEMAERLSLIYKEKENPVSNGSYKDKSIVEIIILDSDSDTDVQMEAPDIVSVAEKDSNEMNNVNVEHVLDEVHSSGLKDSVREPDQFLATSPLSEVKSSDLNIHRTVDSDNTVAEKDSNEKTNVDELYSSGLKYSVGEPDQCLVTLPLIEVKCSDLNIHHMVDSGTAGGNADVSEVKSASSQQQGQEESQMTLEGEKSEDNVRSLHLEENKQMSVIKDKIEDNQEFYQPTTTDLNAHQMVDSGTADGHVDACEESKMKFTPERSYNVDTFYAEDNMQMSVNVLEHFGNYMMMGEDLYGTPVRDTVAEKDSNEKTNVDEVHLSGLKYLFGEPDQCLTTSPLSEVKSSKIHHMVDSDAVAEKTNVDEVHSSGLKYLFREPDQCLTTSPLSEVKSSDLNIHHMVDSGAVAGNADACEVRSVSLQCERSENNVGSFYLEEYTQMSVDKEQIEDNQELSPATPTDLDVVHMVDSGDADDCEGKSASLQVEDDQELHQIEDDQELHQATPTVSQPSETMSCNFSLQQLFALDTCEEEMQDLSEKDKTCMVADLEACIGLLPKNLEAATTKGSEVGTYFDPTILGNVVMETCRIDNVEKEINQDDCFSAQGEVGKFFDNDDFGVDELVQTVPQPSEMESFDFSLQQLFASDTASGDEDAYQKKLDSPSKTTPTASGEKNMVFSPKLHESKMTFQCERSSDNVVSFCFEDLKADELVPTVPQPSEMESYTFSLQQLFSSDTASGDEEAHKAKFDSPSRATPTASGEKSMVFSPKPHESSMRHKEMGIEMSLPLKRARDSIGTHDMKENIKIDKEEVGSIMSKTKFAKRQPLQDLQQN